MEDLLKTLKEHLSTMIEEIDSYTHAKSDDIIIEKKDFKYLKFLGKVNTQHKIFAFKNDITFKLNVSDFYHKDIYAKIMEGALDELILSKRSNLLKFHGFPINYNLESKENTVLRKAYRPIAEENQEN